MMRKNFIPILLFVLMTVVLLLVGGCSANAGHSDPPASAPDADTALVSLSADTAGEVDTGADAQSDDDPVTDPAADAAEPPNYCLDCHTDQQTLIDTAKPEEPVVKESEGEG